MAWNITINFTNDTMNARSRQAFATAYGYQDTIDGQPNPETRNQFRDRMIKRFIKEVTKAEEFKTAQAAVPPVVVEN